MNDVNGYDSTIKYAIMDIVGAINKIESMKQDRYLAMHPYSITHSADGYYRTYLPADDGKRKQIKKKSKSDLEKVVIDYWTKRSPTSFKERYAVWVDRQKLKGVSDNTIYKYQTDYARFLKGKKIEKRDVRTIDEEYLELFFNELLSEKEVPYRALKALFGYLKGVFDKSIRDGLIESNPCLKIDLPLYKRRCEQAIVKMPEERTFSQSEKNRLINSLNKKRKERPDDVLPYAVELALYTGMRVGELSGLMWNDIDEVNKRIIIRHSEKLNRLTNTFYISTPKNGKTRIFPLTIEIAELLKKIKNVEEKYGYLTEFVFSNADGRIHARVISGYMKRRTSNEGFTNPKSIHTARRTLNSELLASGTPRTMCCAMIGNTERVNEEYYTYDVSSTSEKMEIVTRINSRVTSNANGNRNDGSP